MLKGLYAAYSGMLNEQNRMDVLTNNLANSATTGYKKEGSTSQSFGDVLAYRIKDETLAGYSSTKIGVNNPGVKIGENYTDFTQGSMKVTGNTFDMAISGEGFFTIEYTNKAGETSTMYTRDGAFSLSDEGYLVTKDGDFVMGTGLSGATERIKLNPKLKTTVSEDGKLMQNDQTVAALQITDFTDYNYLAHYGENLFRAVEGASVQKAGGSVMGGYLEASNVQIVSEMVDLINITRNYEANQKLIQTYDQSLEISANQLGKI